MNEIALDELLHRAKKITDTVVHENSAELDKQGGWPKEGIHALLKAGLGGLVVPCEYGGQGQGVTALAETCKIIGAKCPSTALCFGMHSVGASVLSANPTERQIEEFLKPICHGEHITTLSLSEPGTGAHFYLPQTSISDSGDDHYLINGVKSFVTNGGHADSYVVSGVEQAGTEIDEFSCLILSSDTSGMRWGGEWDGLGMRGNSSRTLNLDDVSVPKANLLGKQGDQIWYMFNVVAPYFLSAMAGTYTGVAEEAVSIGRQHLMKKKHTHTQNTLAAAPVLQHRLACIWGKLQMIEQFLDHATQRFDSGDESAIPYVLAAKAEVAENAVKIVNEVMTLVGGAGYGRANKLGQMLRDVRASHIMSPTTDILRLWVGRILLEQPILSD